MKKGNWLLVFLLLIGFILGNLLGTYFDGTFLSYGAVFGLTNPVELNLGFIELVFGINFNITIAGILGIILAFVIYKFIR